MYQPLKALVIGDPHFKVANVRETDEMTNAIVKIAKEKNPDIIVVLGDVLDRHETIHVSPLTRAVAFLSELKDISKTYVLIGNHDLKNNRQFLSEEHPFTAVKLWGDKIKVVDSTILETINGHKITFVPYVPCGSFIDALNKCDGWDDSSCIFAHQEFKGCKMGAIISETGDEWNLKNPYVVSGHIHDYQEPQFNILYTGTPIQHAFGDRHDKTISYFNFISKTERQHERIDLKVKKKVLVNITCHEVSAYEPRENCDLKIVINGTSGEIKAIIKHPNIDTWKKSGHKIFYKETPLNKTTTCEESRTSQAPGKFSVVLFDYIKENSKLSGLYNKIFSTI